MRCRSEIGTASPKRTGRRPPRIERSMSESHSELCRRLITTFAFVGGLGLTPGAARSQTFGDIVDAGLDFRKPNQVLFAASRLTAFDPTTGRGSLQWDRYAISPSLNFNKIDLQYSRATSTEFPGTEYDRDPALPFEI